MKHPTPKARVFVIGAVTLLSLAFFVGMASRGPWMSNVLIALPCQLATAWFVAGRRLPSLVGPTVIAALFGGSFSGLAFALSHGSGIIVLVISPFVGTLFGLLAAPFALALQLPMHVASGRARMHPSRDAEHASLLVAGAWLAFGSLLIAIGTLTFGERNVVAVLAPAVTFAIGASAFVISNRKLRALADFTRRVRTGEEPDHRLVPIETHVGQKPEPIWRASPIPKEDDYDVVVLRKVGAPYRDAEGEVAIGTLPAAFDPSIVGRYWGAGGGMGGIVVAAAKWSFAVLVAAGALSVLLLYVA